MERGRMGVGREHMVSCNECGYEREDIVEEGFYYCPICDEYTYFS